MKKSHVPFSETGSFPKLILDYLEGKPYLSSFYKYTPAMESFATAIKDKQQESTDRKLLVDVLKAQYKNISDAAISLNQIASLEQSNTFTVTTGHQLCLFTGPLYFLYKIISTINLADALKAAYPEQHFVPVYWMASEDHDFEEIREVHIFGKNITWDQDQKGATGKIPTHTLKAVFEALKYTLDTSGNSHQLLALFEEAYTLPTLGEATRMLIHRLFGKYGLVVIDGDDQKLKASFRSIIKDDIFNQSNFSLVNTTIETLAAQGFKAQVNPREINCFYKIEGLRERIEKKGEGYRVLNTTLDFTAEQLENEIEEHPERFSPNVVLRPLYQEKILPNLAYVGGPGELSYWLEYKAMFAHHHVNFPVLMLRNCLLILDAATDEKIKKFQLEEKELFLSADEQTKIYLKKQGSLTSFEHEEKQFESIYANIISIAEKIDPTLKATAEAELQKQLNGLKMIEAKLLKAEKQKADVVINQIKKTKEKLFPEGKLQERYENFIPYYMRYGEKFLTTLKENINPFSKEFILLYQENKPN